LLDITSQWCVDGVCRYLYNDEDKDVICEPPDCEDGTASPFCWEDCGLLENGTCG
jgi:hypothetical protein